MSALPESAPPVKLQLAELEIRRMRTGDVQDGVLPIESVSFGRHHWSDESFYNEMNNQVGRYYVLIHTPQASEGQDTPPSRVVGYCGFWLILDEAHVTTVAVHPEMRGNALGEMLLVHIMERSLSSSVRFVTLEVRAGNYNAQNLYYKYGFKSMGMRPKYYQDNQENALIMTTPDLTSEEQRTLYKGLKTRLEEKLGGFPKGLGIS